MTTEDGAPPKAEPAARPDPESAEPAARPDPESPPAPSIAPGQPRRERPKRSFLRELPGIVVTALVISVLIKTFLVQAFYIPSGSMENTLLVNDRVLVNKLADKPDEIHRGDVVVFRDPGGWLEGAAQPGGGGIRGAIRDGLVFIGLAPAVGEEDLIKRVIGVGGDHVVGKANRVSVNDVELTEPYVYPGDESTVQDFDVTVPEDTLWVMGDHRSVSEDSRAHQNQPGKGFVPVDAVIGRAFTVIWPVDRSRLLHVPETFDQSGLRPSAA